MSGGAGADRFEFNALGNSVTGALHDVITDFEAGIDLIDVSSIDANSGKGGNQTFVLLAEGAAFTGVGQLRYFYDSATDQTIVQGNVNNNLAADFEIALSGHQTLSASMFIL